jgi:hypothetical protein
VQQSALYFKVPRLKTRKYPIRITLLLDLLQPPPIFQAITSKQILIPTYIALKDIRMIEPHFLSQSNGFVNNVCLSLYDNFVIFSLRPIHTNIHYCRNHISFRSNETLAMHSLTQERNIFFFDTNGLPPFFERFPL